MNKRIAFVGLGAIGAWIYSQLTQVEDLELLVLADGQRAERLRSDGITVNGKHYDLDVQDYADTMLTPPDYIVIATKMPDFPEILDAITPLVGPETQVLPLQNGLQSEPLAAEHFGWDHVMHGIALVASIREANETRFVSPGYLVLGETSPSQVHPTRLEEFSGFIEVTEIKCIIAEDIRREKWLKFIRNNTNNQYLSIVDLEYPALAKSRELIALMRDLGYEIIRLGEAEGVDITREDVDEILAGYDKLQLPGIPSTLQDLRAGRPTEVDIFAGECMRLGEKHGIEVPLSTTIYRLLKIFEAKNAGVFEMEN